MRAESNHRGSFDLSGPRRRSQVRRMNGDDRSQSAFFVGDEVNFFMSVEVGQAPGRGHLSIESVEENGAIEGT